MSYPKALLHYTDNWTPDEIRDAIITTTEHKFLSDEDMRQLQLYYAWLLKTKQLENLKKTDIMTRSDG